MKLSKTRLSQVSPDGIRFLGPAGLIATKESTHREKDRIDVLALRRILAASAEERPPEP